MVDKETVDEKEILDETTPGGEGGEGGEQFNEEKSNSIIAEKDAEIARLQKELEVEKEKEKNFKNLNQKNKKIEEDKLSIEERLKAVEEEREQERENARKAQEDRRNAIISAESAGDDSVKDKINFYFDRTSPNLSDDERLSLAISLAKGSSVEENHSLNFANSANGSSGYSKPKGEEERFSNTDAGKQLASELNLKYIQKKD